MPPPVHIRVKAIKVVGALSKQVPFAQFSGRITHPLVRIIDNDTAPLELKRVALECLGQLARSFGEGFAIYAPLINRTCIRQGLPALFNTPEGKDECRVFNSLNASPRVSMGGMRSRSISEGLDLRGIPDTTVAPGSQVGQTPQQEEELSTVHKVCLGMQLCTGSPSIAYSMGG